jgi:hypothetical protein
VLVIVLMGKSRLLLAEKRDLRDLAWLEPEVPRWEQGM